MPRKTSNPRTATERLAQHLGWNLKRSGGKYRIKDGTPVNSRTGAPLFVGTKYSPEELLVRATQYGLEDGMTPDDLRTVTRFYVRYADGEPVIDLTSGSGFRLLERVYSEDLYEN